MDWSSFFEDIEDGTLEDAETAPIFPKSWPGAQSFCGATLLLATGAIVATWFLFQREKRIAGAGS